MGKITLSEFQKEYYMLDSRFQKNDEDLFNLGILVAYTSELQNGFIVKRQLKTNSKGTKFNYKAVESQEEADAYCEKVRAMAESLDTNLIANKFKDLINKIEVKGE